MTSHCSLKETLFVGEDRFFLFGYIFMKVLDLRSPWLAAVCELYVVLSSTSLSNTIDEDSLSSSSSGYPPFLL